MISIFSSTFAQEPDPDLFQTWYLQDLFREVGPPLPLIEPPIYPFITISESLDFNGQGACNTFNGTYLFRISDGAMEAIDWNNTNDDCEPEHNSFEDDYFSIMADWWYYEINDDGIGLQLNIYNPLDPYAVFTNYPLSTSDFSKSEIKVYPNPSSSQIFIRSQKEPVIKIELFNLLGEYIHTQNDNIESIDISTLISGIYLLKIYTKNGSAIKKIIKK